MEGLSSFVGAMKARFARPPRERSRPARILVVDDEPSIREFVGAVLVHGGHSVVVAASGAQALELFERDGPFDLLLTDLMMPQMNGDELARRLRRTVPELKVLYLTGYVDRLFKDKPRLWADEAFLEKPCTIGGLLEAIALLTRDRLGQKTVWG
jgi:CheY-like chemotaxis protein